MLKRLPLRTACVVAAIALGFASAASAQEAGSISLQQVLQDLRERNPRLKALGAAADAAAFRVPEASTLPDPMLQLGVMNFGLPDFNTDMAMSMAPSVQLMQMVPFPGKLGLRGEIAEQGSGIAADGAQEAWWQLRAGAAALYYDLWALDKRTAVMRETLALLHDFRQVANALYSAGGGRQSDVLRADVEIARMDGEILQMEAFRVARAARLNGMLDRAPDEPVPVPVLGALPLDVPTADSLRMWAEESRPLLARAEKAVEQAESRRQLAERQIWPDLTFGLAYGQRDRGSGTERMGSAMVGFTLPVHAGRRQYALRDEATAMERSARSDLDGMAAEVGARIGELQAELTRARTLVELYRDEVIPASQASVESAFSSYRVGAVDFMTLIDAQMTTNRYQAELFTLLADYGRAVATLESTVGRELPRTGLLLMEVR